MTAVTNTRTQARNSCMVEGLVNNNKRELATENSDYVLDLFSRYACEVEYNTSAQPLLK